MARFSFQLKGLQLFGLILLWALMSAGLFMIGTLVGYRNHLPSGPETPAGDEGTRASETANSLEHSENLAPANTAESQQASVRISTPPAPPQELDLDRIHHLRTRTPTTPFGDEIYRAASQHSIDPALLAAIVWIESEFDPEARSHKGAVGLMQVMPQTAQRFGYDSERLTDPAFNLDAGSSYLNWLNQRYSGDLALVLGSYNAGEGAVDRYGGLPPYPETRRYVRKVLAAFRSLDGEANLSMRMN